MSGENMEFPSSECDIKRLFAWTNCITNKTYGINVALDNRNTQCGRKQVTIYTDVSTHANTNK